MLLMYKTHLGIDCYKNIDFNYLMQKITFANNNIFEDERNKRTGTERQER